MKKTQIEFIKSELLTKGEISRNHCLRNYISRLSARILDLEKEGWVFTTEKREGDFVYKVLLRPNGGYNWGEETKKLARECQQIIEQNGQLSLSI